MNIAIVDSITNLPALVERAAAALAGARNSAEILEAKELASFSIDMGKRLLRMQKAKKAHDDLIAAIHRAQPERESCS